MDDRDRDQDRDEGRGADEVDGLGLTEEFSRIEEEILADSEPPAGSDSEDATPDSEDAGPSEGDPAGSEPAPVGEQSDPSERASVGEADAGASDGADAEEGDEAPEGDEVPASDGVTEDPGATVASEPVEPPLEDPSQPAQSPRFPAGPPGRPTVPTSAPRPGAARDPVAALAASIPEEELVDKTPSLWMRFFAGSMLVVSSVATAVAIAGLLFFSEIAEDLQPIPGIGAQLAAIEPDDPQTIMILGSDLRADDERGKNGALSDTTMLLRIDPDKDVLSLFSLPRDLKVNIPGFGVDKLNQAYAEGGISKTLKTVTQFTDLDINHAVEINFQGFADAVNAIDCVYIDVDRKYFNDNETTLPPGTEPYAEIDIKSGFQRLCGLKALQYVRYRHNDTDLVRSARQQDFLREARASIEPRELLGAALFGSGTGSDLIDIFTDNTNSDIDDDSQIIGLLKSFANMRNVPVNEVHFEGNIGGPNNPYVTSTDRQVEKAIDEFLNGAGTSGQRGGEEATDTAGDPGGQSDKKKQSNDKPEADVVETSSLPDVTGKLSTVEDRLDKDAAKNNRRLKIPIFSPTELVPGSSFSTDSRAYRYRNEEDTKESAYKTVIAYQPPGTLPEYYGVSGTTWGAPPILRNPSETRTIGGREYRLFYDGDRLRMIGWTEEGASYWLNNTLSQTIGEAEMLSIATSMDRRG